MPSLDENILRSFRAELRKEAGFADLVARAAPTLKNVGSLGGIGATVGALGGAGIGALKNYREAKQEGATTGQAALGGLGGAFQGAGKGALVGGLAGAAGGALMKGDYSGLAQRGGVLGAGSRFGQRQVHALTGMLSPGELASIRGGAYGARESMRHARTSLVSARTPTTFAKGVVGFGRAKKGLEATEKAVDMGLTSVPGYLSAVKQHGVGKVLSTGAKEQLSNASPAMAALMIGMPAVSAAKAMTGSEETDAQGRGRGERVGEEVGRTVGGVAGGVMPLAGQLVVGGALGRAGKALGKGVDRLRGKVPPLGGGPGMSPTTLEPAEGQHTPSERVTSPAAAGQQPDIGL